MVVSVPMFWVGGAPGAGKSTVVRRLAGELDLALHPVDAYTYDHLERLGPLGPPLDEVLAGGAVAAADDFERTSALRLPAVMADVRAAQVAGVPTLVEGPQLHPRAAAAWSPVGAIWLITTAERTRAARRQRLVAGDDERHIGASLPAFPYACVCGRSGCTDTTPATSAGYEAHQGPAPPTLDPRQSWSPRAGPRP